jgi:hypothetical protein
MAYQKILLRRGLQAQIDAAVCSAGEILFTTDTKCVYVYDGAAKNLIGKVLQGAEAARPDAEVSGRLYFATDTKAFWLDSGSAWVQVNVTNLDQLADGTTYGKVKNSELSSGLVKQINDGTNVVSASEARSHIDDETIHRSIDDVSDPVATSLWSSLKTKTYVDNAISGLTWKPPVDSVGASNPATAADGVRFLNTTDKKIYTRTAGAWVGVSPDANWAVLDKTTDAGYTFDVEGAAWVQFSGAGQIVAGQGLDKNGNEIFVNVGAGITILPDDQVGIDIDAAGGLTVGAGGTADQLAIKPDTTTANVAPIALSEAGAGVAVDGSTLEVSSGAIRVKDSGIVEAKIANSAVTTDKIADVNVTTGKLADGAVVADKIGADAVTAAKINSDVAGEGLVQATSGALDVNVDGTTIEIATDALRVKDSGISTAKIAANAVTKAKLNSDIVGIALELHATTNEIDVKYDNSSIKVDGSNKLYVDIIDGGTFA